MNIQELRKADPARSWSEIPAACPANFVAAICEKRAVSIQTKTPIPTPNFGQRMVRSFDACWQSLRELSRRTGKSFEDLLGLPLKKVARPADSSFTNEYSFVMKKKAARQAEEIKREGERLRAQQDREEEVISPAAREAILWSSGV
jgi:hypothetical protein